MKISTKLIESDILGNTETIFLIVIFLHYNNIINREKLKAIFKSINNKSINRKLNIYHCSINNKWYDSDNTMYDVYMDVFNDFTIKSNIIKTYMDMNTMIDYVQLLLNKPKNYCIDHIWFEYIEPFIECYGNNNYFRHFNQKLEYILSFQYDTNSIDKTEYMDYEPRDGYCCSDCDGDYDDYKERHYKYDIVQENKEYIESSFKQYIQSIKKKYLYKK